jgi:ferredoxin
VFRLDENGQAVVDDNTRGSRELLIEAVANCPSEAIALHLVDDPMPA